MVDISTPQFDSVREFMRRHRNAGKQWTGHPLTVTAEWLAEKIEENVWPEVMTLSVWERIRETEKDSEERRQEYITLRRAEGSEAMLAQNEAAEVTVPQNPGSCWQRFKQHLLIQGALDEEDVSALQNSVLETMAHLRRDTFGTAPVKGLVIGHVQSGKTTNMAALMSLAADWGINMFIVLSGRIESLRRQTFSRLNADLLPGHPNWSGLDQPNPAALSQKIHTLNLGNNENSSRYFTVVLKNQTRLTNLRNWLRSYPPALNNMKVLIIDDEADEAGINTGNTAEEDDRTAINDLILDITSLQARAMNYVGYTATPYANVLNEGPGRTLYPSDFIRSLKVSSKYFGPREIFGIEGAANAEGIANADGLDILRKIPSQASREAGLEKLAETAIVVEIQNGVRTNLEGAESLKDSIAWFLCAAATRRLLGHTKPSTMLVHTSQRQGHHKHLANAIEQWLTTTLPNEIADRCEAVWNTETGRFSLESLRQQYPDYKLIDVVKDYPDFGDLYPNIIELLADIRAIPIDDEAHQPAYHRGIHLCIDNCAQNGINDEGEHVRLLYPQPHPAPQPSFSTAFIVVGGATLSRGLTLQGLVSTYFLRDSTLGDSLLQMGRWFGYRMGYELLPRIWLTEDTIDKYRWLAGVEQSLREELKRYEAAGASPAQFGPRVKTHPSVSWLRITAPNRMQGAVNESWDFAGITNQTTMFRNDGAWLEHNINQAENFLGTLEDPHPELIRGGIVYRNIEFDRVEAFLMGMSFHPRNMVFKEIGAFIQWYRGVMIDSCYTAWNVVAAGFDNAVVEIPHGDNPTSWWRVPGGQVKKVTRTRKGDINADGSFSIGALLSPRDRLGDYGGEIQPGTPSLTYVSEKRTEAGLSLTPLLILYRVNRESVYTGKSDNRRHNLDSPSDLLGVAMIIPGDRKQGGLVREVAIKIEKGDLDRPDIIDPDLENNVIQ
jgi:hypothetical protein